MAVKAVVFDVGETLIDETGMWERAADAAGVPRFTLMGILGGLAARGRHHREVWRLLAIEQAHSTWTVEELYDDALPTIDRLRSRGLRVAAVGNTPAATEELLRDHLDVLGSAESWGVEKPAAEFFRRTVDALNLQPAEIAYVGDRVDNDVEPALAAGLVAVHVRRGPWGYLHEPPPEAIAIRGLDELPEALGV
jgi:HAD superfamily hydrolase (TIGR01509 family)